jgi:uncharacterized Ntn-hydrolase superfamily protein
MASPRGAASQNRAARVVDGATAAPTKESAMTFSIVARCADSGQFGVAVCSSSIAVGARCPYVKAEVGAVSSQNVTLPSLGPATLELMSAGLPADQAVAQALGQDPHRDHRQLLAVDKRGQGFVFTGAKALGTHHARTGDHCAAAGNLLATEGVVDAMVECFESTRGRPLAQRLLAALQAAQDAGGEAGPVHAVALLVADRASWPLVNLRVDWADADPIGALAKLLQDYAPQQEAYLQRALDPTAAPSYGVPGDE